MYLNLFRQDIKKTFLLIAFQKSLNSGQKTADFRRYQQILVKNHCRFTAGDLKAFFLFFSLIVFTLTLATIFVSGSFLPKVSKVKERGWKLNLVFGNGKNWQGSAKLSPLLLSPPPSEFCNDEKISVIRSAMDALRNSKKICLLAVAILLVFTFFNLILDAPRTLYIVLSIINYCMLTVQSELERNKGRRLYPTLHRKFETCIPRNETARPCSQFLHSCICEGFIFFQERSPAVWSWEYINRSQIHECGNWETEHYNSVLEITRSRSFISGNT